MSNNITRVTALRRHTSNLSHGLSKNQNYKISVTLEVLINVKKYMFKGALMQI